MNLGFNFLIYNKATMERFINANHKVNCLNLRISFDDVPFPEMTTAGSDLQITFGECLKNIRATNVYIDFTLKSHLNELSKYRKEEIIQFVFDSIASNRSIESLELRCNNMIISSPDCNPLKRLEKNKSIKNLKIGFEFFNFVRKNEETDVIEKEKFDNYQKFSFANTSVKRLELVHVKNYSTNNDIKGRLIFEALRNNQVLEELFLPSCNFVGGSKFGRALCAFLRSSFSLKVLDLSHNDFSKLDWGVFVESCRVETLHLNYTGIRTLSRVSKWKENDTIKHLYLSNSLTELTCLSKLPHSLHTLDISFCTRANTRPVSTKISELLEFPFLTTLNICGNYFGKMKSLIDFIERTNVRYLNLFVSSHLTGPFYSSFGDVCYAFERNNSITECDHAACGFLDEQNIIFVDRCLAANTRKLLGRRTKRAY